MYKLKKKKIIKNKNCSKKIFTNDKKIYNEIILYKLKNFNILEFTENKNIYIPKKKSKSFFTLNKKFKNKVSFNYTLNYNILYNFNKIMFIFNKINIKGRIFSFYIKRENNFIFCILFLGIIFYIKNNNLYDYYFIIYNKNNIYKKINKKNKYNYYKKKNKIEQLIRFNFNSKYIKMNINKSKKFFFTRISYVEKIKSNFSRKIKPKINKYATI